MEDKFIYEGNIYTRLNIVEMKDPTTRMWLIAVLYENKHGEKFVRHIADFASKFKPLSKQ